MRLKPVGKKLNAKCDFALSSKSKGATMGRDWAARLALCDCSVEKGQKRARMAVAIGGALDPSSPAAGVPPHQPLL